MVSSEDESAGTVRGLIALSLPAAAIGVVCALVLFGLEELSALLENALWEGLPRVVGFHPDSGWWIFTVLTLTGLAVGLAIRFVPGHGGRDSATTELIAPPLPLHALPSLALVAVLGLAGGVSLGPESPIIAINTGILVAAFGKFWPGVSNQLIVLITAAATIGALFGTPVAAALVFTGIVGSMADGRALWDRLFLPLLAAGVGAVTMTLLTEPTFAVTMPAYDSIAAIDLLSVTVIAAAAALIGIAAAAVFPFVHRTFRLLRNPVLYVTLGGAALGVLGVIGGPITLFKGLEQTATLVVDREDYSSGQLVVIVAVKLVALVIAAAAGFRGGRIFPAVFIGTAIGVLANALLPGIPIVVAIAGGVLGIVLAVSRDGWIALFIAVAVTGSVTVLAILCIAILPTWLIVSRAPEMLAQAGEDRGRPGVVSG